MRIGPLGIWELLIILVVVLLIFGPRRLPEMAKGIGQSVREFRKGIRDMKDDFESGANNDEQPQTKQASAPAAAAPAVKRPAAKDAPVGKDTKDTPVVNEADAAAADSDLGTDEPVPVTSVEGKSV